MEEVDVLKKQGAASSEINIKLFDEGTDLGRAFGVYDRVFF